MPRFSRSTSASARLGKFAFLVTGDHRYTDAPHPRRVRRQPYFPNAIFQTSSWATLDKLWMPTGRGLRFYGTRYRSAKLMLTRPPLVYSENPHHPSNPAFPTGGGVGGFVLAVASLIVVRRVDPGPAAAWTGARRGRRGAGRAWRGCGGEMRFRPNAQLRFLTATPDRDMHLDRIWVRNSMLAAWDCGACSLAQSGPAVGCVRYAKGWRPSALRSALMSARHARLSM
jgi:hypothetical protein